MLPKVYAWTPTLGWFAFNAISIPVASTKSLPDTGGGNSACKTNPHICLREGDNPYLEEEEPPPVNPADVSLLGSIPPSADDDFPVTFNRVKYLGTLRSDASSALNPVKQNLVRDILYRNVIMAKPSASKSCGENTGSSLLKFTSKDNLYYCQGDVHLTDSLSNWKGNKTIIVEGGNLTIEKTLTSEEGQLGIIVLRKNHLKKATEGNIFIGPEVREIRAQIYADGSVLPVNAEFEFPPNPSDYLPTRPDDKPTLFGQLLIRGMIVARNTATFRDPNADDDGGISLPKEFEITDLATLRSVPADPGSKLPRNWDGYIEAITTGQGWKHSVDKKTKKLLDESGDVVKAVKDTEHIPFKTKKSTPAQLKKLENRMFDPNKVVLGPNDKSTGVYIQFEPPGPELPVFQGRSIQSTKQIR
jgi:hypothetical protein